MKDLYAQATEAAEFIRSAYNGGFETVIVLGSGLGGLADDFDDPVRIPYEAIPYFASSTVVGHAGQLVLGQLDGISVVVQQGRFHFYEGYEMDRVTFPMRTFGRLGVKNVILTNAAGSLDTDMIPGSLMLITDHLNCMGVNPLRGPNDDRFGPRFPDMTAVYDKQLQEVVVAEANQIATERFEKGLDKEQVDFLHRGVYCALSGPTYETPAEIHFYRLLGADAVGMSTVPEAVIARHQGMSVVGISCISNFGAGMTSEAIDHNEVMETGARVSELFRQLLRRVVKRISGQELT